jgi:hypothetical protein
MVNAHRVGIPEHVGLLAFQLIHFCIRYELVTLHRKAINRDPIIEKSKHKHSHSINMPCNV